MVGAGVVGLSTAYALTELGAAVTIYEVGAPGGSQSGGRTRLFRHAHDDPRLVSAAVASREIYAFWERRFAVELVSGDGAVAISPPVRDRFATLQQVGGTRARLIEVDELTDRLPLLARHPGPALLDEDAGAIRAHAVIGMLRQAVGDVLVTDEVLSVRPKTHDRVEIRGGDVRREHDRIVVCAGRQTARLARGVGLALPVEVRAQMRATFAVRVPASERLAGWQDASGDFGEVGVYATPLAGNRRYAVGPGASTPADRDGALLDPSDLERNVERTCAYVRRALPGLDPAPVALRHCWVTALPWHEDGVAAWQVDGVLFVAGNNLFKHAPWVRRKLARAAIDAPLTDLLRPDARLGAPPPRVRDGAPTC